jgi:uncharacterized damage-inducible protein DinB
MMADTTLTKNEFLAQSASDFRFAIDRLVNALNHVPADRLTWSPSPTARNPVEVVGHTAQAIKNMLGNLTGDTFAIPNSEEAERIFREEDRKYKDKDTVLAQLNANADAYLAWLQGVSDDELEEVLPMPFGLPSMPRRAVIGFMAIHVMCHAAQVDYIQTIYGDRDWHLGI